MGIRRLSLQLHLGLLILAIVSPHAFAADPATAPAAPAEVELVDLPAEKACNVVFVVMSAGRDAEVGQMLQQLTTAHPENQRLAFFQAAYRRAWFPGTIGRNFDAVAAMNPDSTLGQFAKLLRTVDANRTDDVSFDAFRKLVDEHLDDPLIVWMAAVECRTIKRNDAGLQYFRQICPLMAPNEGPWDMHHSFGNLLETMDINPETLPHRLIAIKRAPSVMTYNALGNTYSRLHRYTDAYDAYQKAIALDPKDARDWNNSAKCLLNLGNYARAVEASRRAVELNPTESSYWYQLGCDLYPLKRYDEAADAFSKSATFDPKNAHCFFSWGLSFAQIEKYDEAIPRLEQSVGLDPKHVGAQKWLAYCLDKVGRSADALPYYANAREFDPTDGWSYTAAVAILRKLGKSAEADELDAQWKKIAPSNPTPALEGIDAVAITDLPPDQAYEAVVKIWTAGNQTAAYQLLASLTEKYPSDLRLAFFRAVDYRGSYGVDRDHLFDKVIAIGPNSPEGQCARLMITIDAHLNELGEVPNLVKLADAHLNDPLIVWMAGEACEYHRQTEQSLKYFEQLNNTFKPGSFGIHRGYAEALHDAQRYEEELKQNLQIVNLEPTTGAYYNLATTYAFLHRYDKSVESLRTGLSIDPEDTGSLSELVHYLKDMKKYDEALAAADQATAAAPNAISILALRPGILVAMERYDEALEAYKHIREALPNESLGYTGAAQVLRQMGNLAEARAMNEEWQKILAARRARGRASTRPATRASQ